MLALSTHWLETCYAYQVAIFPIGINETVREIATMIVVSFTVGLKVSNSQAHEFDCNC